MKSNTLVATLVISTLLLLTGCNQDTGISGDSTSGVIVSPSGNNGVVTLDWTPPLENTDGSSLNNLSGYVIYFGTEPGSYTDTIAINNSGITSYTIDNLVENQTYYFTMTAVNSEGIQSDYSNYASKYL